MYIINVFRIGLRKNVPGVRGHFGGDFTSRVSPQGGDFTRDLLDRKSKSRLFPGPGGAVVTIDWCIKRNRKSIYKLPSHRVFPVTKYLYRHEMVMFFL